MNSPLPMCGKFQTLCILNAELFVQKKIMRIGSRIIFHRVGATLALFLAGVEERLTVMSLIFFFPTTTVILLFHVVNRDLGFQQFSLIRHNLQEIGFMPIIYENS